MAQLFEQGAADPGEDGGEFEESDSPYGTFEKGGNVFERTDAAMSSVSRGERDGSLRGSQSEPNDWLHASVRSSTGAAINAGALGFRVAEVPEPGPHSSRRSVP